MCTVCIFIALCSQSMRAIENSLLPIAVVIVCPEVFVYWVSVSGNKVLKAMCFFGDDDG